MSDMQERMAEDPWSWDDVRLFLAAWRTRSLTGAARALGVHQSSASRRLTALETALGARLFDRVREGLEPTELAHQAVGPAEAAEQAMHAFARAIAGTSGDLRGTVRLAVADGMDSLLVVPFLSRFYEKFPDITLELVASASVMNLARREADLALRFVRPATGDLVCKRVARMQNGVWGTPTRVAEGLDCPWVDWDEGQGAPEEARWMGRNLPRARVVLRTNRIEAKLAAARAGLGLAILPDAMGRQFPDLVRVEAEPIPPCDLWLVAHRGLIDVPRVRAVWEFAEQLARDLLDEGV